MTTFASKDDEEESKRKRRTALNLAHKKNKNVFTCVAYNTYSHKLLFIAL